MHAVTVSDVARAANVSTATVSRALNGSHKVSATTIAHVREVADRLGYSGNPIARALRKNVTGTIGMLVPSIRNPFFTGLVDQVEHELSDVGLNLFLCDSRNDPRVEARKLASLTQGSVDGILISPCDRTRSAEAVRAAAARIPLVQVDRETAGAESDWVGLDDAQAIGQIVRHLADRGVRRAALVTSTEANSSAHARRSAALAEFEEAGITVRPDQLLDGAFSLDWGVLAADRLLETPELPDAIMCLDDLIALGVLSRLNDNGTRVPDDVLVTGFDDIEFSALSRPSLTTLRQPVGLIATEAVRLLRHTIETPDRAKTRVLLRGELASRGSSARTADTQRPAEKDLASPGHLRD